MIITKNMKKSVFSLVSVTVAAVLLFSAVTALGQEAPEGNASASESSEDMLFRLLLIQADVQGSLSNMDSDVANISQNLSATDLEGDEAREVLSKLLESNSNLSDAITISKDGKIMIAECKGCKGVKGDDISGQEHIAHFLTTKAPTLSREFLTVEGYNATALVYPVFSPNGEFKGGVSSIFEPDKVLSNLIATRLNETSYSFWVMEPDGLIVYDRDASQIGKNLFEDPLYRPFQSLLTLGEKMVAERAGHGSYDFQVTEGNKTVVTKDVYWTTAGLHDKEWRLAITRIVE